MSRYKRVQVFDDHDRTFKPYDLNLDSVVAFGPPMTQYGQSGPFPTRQVYTSGQSFFVKTADADAVIAETGVPERSSPKE